MKLRSEDLNFHQLIGEYDEKGWIKIPGVIEEKDVEEIISHVRSFVGRNLEKFQPREINFVEGEVNSVHCLHLYEDAFLQGIQGNETLKHVVSKLLGGEAVCRGSEAFMKPAKKGLPSPMHQDNFYWCVEGGAALTCWIALDDIDESNGAVSYYDGSHKMGLIDHVPSYAPGSSQKVPDEALKDLGRLSVPSLRKGDMLVHHALTIHGSAANTSGRSRRGMTIQYKLKDAGYDLAQKKRYEESLNEQIKSRQG